MTIKERLDRIERLIITTSKEVLSVSECAILMNKSESRIRHMASERLIPYYKDGNRTLFKKSEIESAMLKHRVPTAKEISEHASTYVSINTNDN